jgi:hypothetical protein
VRLTDATGSTYWLELRAAVGRDAWLGAAGNRFGLDSGVLLHRTGRMPDTALLLDGTPSTAARWDDDLQAALPVGVPVPVAGGAFTVTVDAVTAAGATLTVVPAAGAAVPVTPLPEGDPAPEVLAAAPARGVRRPGAATAAPAGSPRGRAARRRPRRRGPEAPVAPVAAGVLLTEPVPAAVRVASRADWAPPAAAAAGVGSWCSPAGRSPAAWRARPGLSPRLHFRVRPADEGTGPSRLETPCHLRVPPGCWPRRRSRRRPPGAGRTAGRARGDPHQRRDGHR